MAEAVERAAPVAEDCIAPNPRQPQPAGYPAIRIVRTHCFTAGSGLRAAITRRSSLHHSAACCKLPGRRLPPLNKPEVPCGIRSSFCMPSSHGWHGTMPLPGCCRLEVGQHVMCTGCIWALQELPPAGCGTSTLLWNRAEGPTSSMPYL